MTEVDRSKYLRIVPTWPLHAALAGVDPEFACWPVQYGWWLTRREGLLKKAGFRQ